MKHEREDNSDAGPAAKRHRTEESNPQGQAQGLTPNDALGYLRAVKEMFRDNKGKYDEFLVVMKDFKAQRIDTDGVIVRVKELFRGHRDLILGFNAFLPKGYEITLEEGPKRQPVEFQQAINYVNKIKFRFQHDETIYKAFLEILNLYRKGNKSISEVYKEVSVIFKEHADLLEEFACFLPDTNGYVNLHSKVQDGSMLPHKLQVERAVKRETVEALPEDECSSERPDSHSSVAVMNGKDQHKKLLMEAHGVERRLKTYPEDQQPNKCISTRIVNDLKCTLEDDKGEPCVVTPSSFPSAEKNLPKPVQKQLGFFELVKDTLQSPETYQEFLKCLNLYSKEIITRDRLTYMVNKIFLKFPDLINGFSEFLRHCETNEGYLANIIFNKSDGSNVAGKEWKRDKDVDKNKGEAGQGMEKKKELDKHHPLRISNATNGNKYMTKPISELDLTECKQCTPSYRLLPENYPIPKVSSRTPLGNIVLNDSWVSVTSGSEEAPFKHMRKNQYEESLFRCEDDRFELDMLVESTGVTTRRLEELMKRIQDENIKEQICIDDYLTAIQLRCIERIYGDHGLDVLELLRKNLTVALPIVMNRLKQKQDEWLKCRTDMNKVWAEVYAKNYHKSLDHRSFHFKQQDKKRLSAKALLAEIKEANGKNRKGDEFILSLAAGNARPFIPDLMLEYPDHCMNEDLYEIVKHSADEMCTTSEQAEKVMSLWKQFLEPMFGESYHKENAMRKVSLKPIRSQDFVSTDGPARVSRDGKKGVIKCDNAINSQTGSTMQLTSNVHEGKWEAEKRLNLSDIKADSIWLDNSIPDISKNGCLVKVEREEGELSPSQDADENHVGVDGSEDSLHTTSLENMGIVKVVQSQDCLSSEEEKGARNCGSVIEEEDENLQRLSSGSFEAGEMSCSESLEDYSEEEQIVKKDTSRKRVDNPNSNRHITGSDRRISRCKALVLHSPSISNSVSAEDCKLFYGNDNIYLLFRLHQALHERIHAAKVYAAATEEKMKTSKDISSPQLYHKFLQALYDLLDGTADNAKFEDICRSIIGTQSYLMFTMDKLIFKLVKQLQAIASDETASKLLMLHAYQKSHAHGLVDSTYHANACMVLHDENVYRFERRSKPTNQLFIQLMDAGPDRSDVFANAVETSFAKYLDKFLSKEPLPKEERPPIYLKRNMVHYNLKSDQKGLINALENVDIVNGLDYKISCNTYTVSYVLDTEDFLHRKRKKRRVSIDARGNAVRFNVWLDKQRGISTSIENKIKKLGDKRIFERC